MSALDTSDVLTTISDRILAETASLWEPSPWPGELFRRDDETGQVSPYSGNRFSLIPTSTEPASDTDAANLRARRTQRNVRTFIDVRWSATTPIDDGAAPFHDTLEAERALIEAATKPDASPLRVLWLRSTRTVQTTGWVTGTITLQAHHEIEMR